MWNTRTRRPPTQPWYRIGAQKARVATAGAAWRDGDFVQRDLDAPDILFLAANPHGTDRRALDQEASSIRKELKRSGYRERFEIVTRWAAEPLDLLRELRELKPAVVHFNGHGNRAGLTFQTAGGTGMGRDQRSAGDAAVRAPGLGLGGGVRS
jgi:hypothetical protein